MAYCSECGGTINSFSGKCPFCGTEISGLKGSESIKDFSNSLTAATSVEHKIDLIKTFPIPNTKEDIWEYMILASSNISYHDTKDSKKEAFEEAWITKFFQCYKKANLVFGKEADFKNFQMLFDETVSRLNHAEKRKNAKFFLLLAVKSLGVIIGSVAALIAVCMDMSGNNGSLIELLSIILLIVSATTLKKRAAQYIEYGIAFASGLWLIILSFLLDNGSLFELGGAILLIIVAVLFLGNLKDIAPHS